MDNECVFLRKTDFKLPYIRKCCCVRGGKPAPYGWKCPRGRVGEGLRALPPENVYIFSICEANNNIISFGNCDLLYKSPGGDRAPPLQSSTDIYDCKGGAMGAPPTQADVGHRNRTQCLDALVSPAINERTFLNASSRLSRQAHGEIFAAS